MSVVICQDGAVPDVAALIRATLAQDREPGHLSRSQSLTIAAPFQVRPIAFTRDEIVERRQIQVLLVKRGGLLEYMK